MAQVPSTEDLHEGDGTTTVFQFTFPYLKVAEVFVTVDGVNVPFNMLVGSTSQLQTLTPPPAGSVVRIYRDTLAIKPLHLFTQGVPFLPRYVDENNRQLLYATQEAINDTAVTAAEALVVAEEAKDIAQRAEDKIDGAIIDSSFQLRLDLANGTDPLKGAALVGFGPSNVAAVLTNLRKREIGDVMHLEDYVPEGALLSDPGVFNDAWDACVAAQVRPSTILIPSGYFSLVRPCFLNAAIPTLVRGAGAYSTVVEAGPGVAAIFYTPNPTLPQYYVTGHHLEGMALLGNGQAATAYQCERWTHGSLVDLVVTGTTIAGVRFNDGYSNLLSHVKIHSNAGTGLDMGELNVNNNTLLACMIYANEGVGLAVGSGWGNVLLSCGIEANKITGIAAWDIRGFAIIGGYMERNAATGYSFTTAAGSPETFTVRADVVLLRAGRQLFTIQQGVGAPGFVMQGVSCTPYGFGNVPTSGLGQNVVVYTNSLDNFRMTECDLSSESNRYDAAVGVYNDNNYTTCASAIIENNTRNDVAFIGGNPARAFSGGHNLTNRLSDAYNYAPTARADYLIQSGTTGVLRDSVSGLRHGRDVSWEMTPGDSFYGFVIDLTLNPELRGKLVWFGVHYRITDANSSLQLTLGTSSLLSAAPPSSLVTPAGQWLYASIAHRIDPAATFVAATFGRLGGGTGAIQLAHPTLTLVGASRKA